MNRIGPPISELDAFVLPQYEKIVLDNGIPVSLLRSPAPDIVKMSIIFNAGRYYEKQRGVAKVTSNVIKEGSSCMNSAQIAERIDYYGAYISTGSGMDTAYLEASFLGRFFEDIIKIINEILQNPVFEESELEKYKVRKVERLKIDISKNDILAYRYFTEKLYGEYHPYGYNSRPEDYMEVSREHVFDHYDRYFVPQNCLILITGNITDERIKVLNNTIGKFRKANDPNVVSPQERQAITSSGKFLYNSNRYFQTSIRIGKRICTRNHPDYPALYLLNTILGGYFGARLSTNIREDKGQTYGIYSSLEMMLRDGFLIISTNVGNEYTEQTLSEIYREIMILKTEPVPASELKMVKNYIKGSLLSMLNGNINTLNLIKTLELSKLDRSFFEQFMKLISITESEEILMLANKYFNEEEFTEVLVGSMPI